MSRDALIVPDRAAIPCAARSTRSVLGRSQVVRQRILIPPSPGSNPGAPAKFVPSFHRFDRGAARSPVSLRNRLAGARRTIFSRPKRFAPSRSEPEGRFGQPPHGREAMMPSAPGTSVSRRQTTCRSLTSSEPAAITRRSGSGRPTNGRITRRCPFIGWRNRFPAAASPSSPRRRRSSPARAIRDRARLTMAPPSSSASIRVTRRRIMICASRTSRSIASTRARRIRRPTFRWRSCGDVRRAATSRRWRHASMGCRPIAAIA